MKKILGLMAMMMLMAHSFAANLINGDVLSLKAEKDLQKQVKRLAAAESGSIWFAWEVEGVAGQHSCCDPEMNFRNCRCTLGDDDNWYIHNDVAGPASMLVALGLEQGSAIRLRFFKGQCEVDAGNRRVIILEGVASSSSLDYLQSLLETSSKNVAEGALSAIANHLDPRADGILRDLAFDSHSRHQQEQAVFWLGQARGRAGFVILRELLEGAASANLREKITFGLHISGEKEAQGLLMGLAKEDASSKVRGQAIFWLGQKGGPELETFISNLIWENPDAEENEQAVMALSQFPDDSGLPALMQLAKEHPKGKIRSRALFWLAQEAGQKATETLVDAVGDDPDQEVKEAAVFALSQLGEEGIPHLIKVAKTHPMAEIRKRAFFWLGQSGSDEALALIESVLTEQ